MMHPVYMAVTQDKYELPIAWAESAWELAQMFGVTVYPILHATVSKDKRPIKNSKYKLVWVNDQDDD